MFVNEHLGFGNGLGNAHVAGRTKSSNAPEVPVPRNVDAGGFEPFFFARMWAQLKLQK